MTGVLRGDATRLPLLDESVHCVVTSPPYNLGIEYGDHYVDALDWDDYEFMTDGAAREMFRVLVPGGRVWLNVMAACPVKDDTERYPLAHQWAYALRGAGFENRDTVIWVQDSHDGACSWGSWKSPSAPNLRGGYEVILSFYKPPYRRLGPKGYRDDFEVSHGMAPWTELVRNVWTMKPARRRIGAPAPFPLELPLRCIRLSTYPGEVVLDPFAGSGVTLDAAEQLGRVGLGYDLGA